MNVRHWINPERTMAYFGVVIEVMDDGKLLVQVGGRMSKDGTIVYRSQLNSKYRVVDPTDELLEYLLPTGPSEKTLAEAASLANTMLQKKKLDDEAVRSYDREMRARNDNSQRRRA